MILPAAQPGDQAHQNDVDKKHGCLQRESTTLAALYAGMTACQAGDQQVTRSQEHFQIADSRSQIFQSSIVKSSV